MRKLKREFVSISLKQLKNQGGIFNIVDDTLDLNLRLVRVHTEYLSHLGPRSFFACVDLADDQFNNKSLYLELDESHSHKEISIAYRVKRLEKNPYPAEDGESLEQYLKSNTLIPVDDRFKEIELSFLMGEILILILDQLLGILILWLTLLWRLMNLSLDQKRLLLLKER